MACFVHIQRLNEDTCIFNSIRPHKSEIQFFMENLAVQKYCFNFQWKEVDKSVFFIPNISRQENCLIIRLKQKVWCHLEWNINIYIISIVDGWLHIGHSFHKIMCVLTIHKISIGNLILSERRVCNIKIYQPISVAAGGITIAWKRTSLAERFLVTKFHSLLTNVLVQHSSNKVVDM